MPLTPPAVQLGSWRSVHDGSMFAREVLSELPRTPEASRILIEGLRLQPDRPTYISPRCNYEQVRSDAGLAPDWMEQRARLFHEWARLRAERTPPPPPSAKAERIPIEGWTTHDRAAVRRKVVFRRNE